GKTLRTSISWFMRLRASASAWARALPNHGRERLLLVGGRTRSESSRGGRCVLRRPPTALDFLVFAPRLLIANAERIVRRPALAREGAAEGERPCPLRIRGGEENAHRTALGDADQGCTLRPGGVHDHSHVVHARLQRWDAADAVGHSRSPLVEAN